MTHTAAIHKAPFSQSQKTKPPTPSSADDAGKLSEVEILARTIYGEARGESIAGKEAVASVVINRVSRAKAAGGWYWWGDSVRAVCLKPWQFSCWNRNDPNRAKVLAVGKGNRNFQTCRRIARRAIAGALKDRTRGSTHYHASQVDPLWARGRMFATEIGNHQFYNNVE